MPELSPKSVVTEFFFLSGVSRHWDSCEGFYRSVPRSFIQRVETCYKKDWDTATFRVEITPQAMVAPPQKQIAELARQAGLVCVNTIHLPTNEQSLFMSQLFTGAKKLGCGFTNLKEAMDRLHIEIVNKTTSNNEYEVMQPTAILLKSKSPVIETKETNIDVHFIRNGQWQQARLKQLTSTKAHILTSTPPRPTDEVHITLTHNKSSVLVEGEVTFVTPRQEALQTGYSGFVTHFSSNSVVQKQSLRLFLYNALKANVEIIPPPRRVEPRFVLQWPICICHHHTGHKETVLDTNNNQNNNQNNQNNNNQNSLQLKNSPASPAGTTGTILNISHSGMLFKTTQTLRGTISFSITVRDQLVIGTAIVLRNQLLSAETPSAEPIHQYGVRMLHIYPRPIWNEFVDTIFRRTQKKILIGAKMPQLAFLSQRLADAGYAIDRVSDPEILIENSVNGTAPDAVIIDDNLCSRDTNLWVTELLTRHKIPCVTTQGKANDKTLSALDQLLRVV